MGQLDGKIVAILATDGFEAIELTSPRAALEGEGASCEVVSLRPGVIRGFNEFEPAVEMAVVAVVESVTHDRFDALLLPGGTINADKLRAEAAVRRFVWSFFDAGKPVAAICHAPWILIDADVVAGRQVTSFPTIRRDLENADARWCDQEAVVDGQLVTSRGPDDLPAFNAATVRLFARS